MKVLNVIKKCKELDEDTVFECKLDSGAKASRVMFRLQEHFLGKAKIVSEHKLGRFLVKVVCEYEGCIAHYEARSKIFSFSRIPSYKTSKVISTIQKAKQVKLANVVSVENFNIKNNLVREQVGSRGGGVEIKLDKLGEEYKGEKMSAYQNYLGGGMLGSVASNNTIERQGGNMARQNISDEMRDTLAKLEMRLRKYYFELTNPDEDEWEHQEFEQNQSLPVSAY